VPTTRHHGFLIAAPQSGSGKTTLCLAIMAALTRRGLAVMPFKCGPDFIDPGYHRAITGRASINLDSWMCSTEFLRQTFLSALASPPSRSDNPIAIIEGVMGLFDGIGPSCSEGSSASIAALTGMPVVLVVNARGMAASAAALVKGFARFDPLVTVAGVIFNNVGSDSHAALLREVLQQHTGLPCFGCLPRASEVEIPSRHLGLVTSEDRPLPPEFIAQLADLAERCLQLDELLLLGSDSLSHATTPANRSPNRVESSPRIAVARDEAFCFCYDDNLRLLREAGAELVSFSPLHDRALPPRISGIYLPGGYPELYAAQLADNRAMRQEIKQAVESGMPVYGECGGFMYLTKGMLDGADFVGVFPVRARMLPKRKALGYREAWLLQDTILGPAGVTMRGHEFHYSEIGEMPATVERCYRVTRRGEHICDEGYRHKNCLGSYLHLHFGSLPSLASSLIAACRRYGST